MLWVWTPPSHNSTRSNCHNLYIIKTVLAFFKSMQFVCIVTCSLYWIDQHPSLGSISQCRQTGVNSTGWSVMRWSTTFDPKSSITWLLTNAWTQPSSSAQQQHSPIFYRLLSWQFPHLKPQKSSYLSCLVICARPRRWLAYRTYQVFRSVIPSRQLLSSNYNSSVALLCLMIVI